MRRASMKRPSSVLGTVAVLVTIPWLCLAGEPDIPGARDPRITDTRTVPRPEIVSPATPPVREPAFELAGVARMEGAAPLALLQEPELTRGVSILLRQGDSIGAYRLVAVEDDRVRLESPDGALTVLLALSRGPAATAARPQPARATARSEVGGPQASSVPVSPPPPAPAEAQGIRLLESAVGAEAAVEASLEGTPGGEIMNRLKNVFRFGLPQ